MQGLLFGSAIDRFFINLEEPPKSEELACSEELYRVALQCRTYQDDDHEQYDYQPITQDAPMATTDYARGYSAGYDGIYSVVIQNRNNPEFLAGHAAGSKRRMMEYRSTCNETFQTSGMLKGADARVIRGTIQK